MIIVLGFAMIMAIVLVAVVSTMIHIQQKKVLDLEREKLRRIEILFRPQTDAKNQTLLITKEHIHHEWLNGDSVRLMQVFTDLTQRQATVVPLTEF